MESLIAQYLIGLTELFPESLKPKHHFLVHYPTIMRRMGPLWNLSTMRCEHKNQDLKKYVKVSLSRINTPKSLAIKNQLSFSYRIRRNDSLHDSVFEEGSLESSFVQELPQIYFYQSLLPFLSENREVTVISDISFQGTTIARDVV